MGSRPGWWCGHSQRCGGGGGTASQCPPQAPLYPSSTSKYTRHFSPILLSSELASCLYFTCSLHHGKNRTVPIESIKASGSRVPQVQGGNQTRSPGLLAPIQGVCMPHWHSSLPLAQPIGGSRAAFTPPSLKQTPGWEGQTNVLFPAACPCLGSLPSFQVVGLSACG